MSTVIVQFRTYWILFDSMAEFFVRHFDIYIKTENCNDKNRNLYAKSKDNWRIIICIIIFIEFIEETYSGA